MKAQSDEQLMNEVKAGQLASLGELFERYHKELYNFFLKMTAELEASEDLVQTTFTRILAYRLSYREGEKFRSWMYKIGRNARIDHFRKNQLQMDAFREVSEMDNQEPGAIDNMLREERLQALQEALERLPEDQREVLLLHRYEGMKYQEISEITGNSAVAIRVKAHRALNKLREIYFQIA